MIDKFDEFVNEARDIEYIPVVDRLPEPHRDGRDIRVGMRLRGNTVYLYDMNMTELMNLKNEIDNFLKTNN